MVAPLSFSIIRSLGRVSRSLINVFLLFLLVMVVHCCLPHRTGQEGINVAQGLVECTYVTSFTDRAQENDGNGCWTWTCTYQSQTRTVPIANGLNNCQRGSNNNNRNGLLTHRAQSDNGSQLKTPWANIPSAEATDGSGSSDAFLLEVFLRQQATFLPSLLVSFFVSRGCSFRLLCQLRDF